MKPRQISRLLVKVGSLVQAGSHTNWRGIVLQVKESTRSGLHCNPELRYECEVKWFNTGYPELDGVSWWGAWSLKVL